MYVLSRKKKGTTYYLSGGWNVAEAKKFAAWIGQQGDRAWILSGPERHMLGYHRRLNDNIIYDIKKRFYKGD